MIFTIISTVASVIGIAGLVVLTILAQPNAAQVGDRAFILIALASALPSILLLIQGIVILGISNERRNYRSYNRG